MVRILIALSVLVPAAAGVTALLLVARSLARSWTWAGAGVACFAAVYSGLVVGIARWSRAHPQRARRLGASWGRAMAFGSGGRERPEVDEDDRRG